MLKLISGYFLLLCAVVLGGVQHASVHQPCPDNDPAEHEIYIASIDAYGAIHTFFGEQRDKFDGPSKAAGLPFLEFFAEEVEEDDDKHPLYWRPSVNGTTISRVCDQAFLRQSALMCRNLLMGNARAHNNNTSLQVLEVFRL